MKIYYENSYGSYVFASNEDEVISVLSNQYEINNTELNIREVDLIKEGYYVGKNIGLNDYTFGDIVNEFKDYYDRGSYFEEFKVIKSKYGFKKWKRFVDILQELDLVYCLKEGKSIEPFELFSCED